LGDLDVVRRFLGIFDVNLPLRVTVGSYVRERFGAGAHLPFLSLEQAVQDERARPGDCAGAGEAAADLRALLTAPYWSPPALAQMRTDRLRVLDGLRAQAREVVLSQPEAGGVVRVDPGVLAGEMAGWPDWLDVPDSAGCTSVGCYVQPWQPGQALHLVLNGIYAGYGRGRSRLRHQLSLAAGSTGMGEDGGEELWRAPRSGPVLAEWGGMLGMTLNVRVPGTPFEIDYPYSVSGRDAAERLPLNDLHVVHDQSTDLVTLSSRRLGATVLPVHLGMAADFALPPAVRLAAQVFSPHYRMHPNNPPLVSADYWERTRMPAEVARHPRVEVGRVVAQRARWTAPAGLVPRRAAGEPDAAFLLRLAAWLRREAVPDRTFVRTWGGRTPTEKIKARKPVYLDIASPWLVALFERQVGVSERVIFEEVLPAPEEAPGRGAEGATVTEFLVEISDG
jgi:hypothetical protein